MTTQPATETQQQKTTRILTAPTNRRKGWIGGQLFANGSDLSQFKSLGGYLDRVNQMDTVYERPVFLGQYPLKGIKDSAPEPTNLLLPEATTDIAGDYKAYAWNRSNNPVSVVSSLYEAIQSKEALMDVGEVLRQYNVDPKGLVTETERGHLNAKLYFQNPEYAFQPSVTLQDGKADLIALGVQLGNSYGAPSMAFTCQGFAVRQICCNFNLWGEWLGKESVRHIGDVQTEVAGVLNGLLKQVPFMQKTIDVAAEFVFPDMGTVEAALRGIKIGPNATKSVLDQRAILEPSWVKESPSAWQVYNALTALATHSGISQDSQDEYLNKANGLLRVKNMDKTIAHGQKLLEDERALALVNVTKAK